MRSHLVNNSEAPSPGNRIPAETIPDNQSDETEGTVVGKKGGKTLGGEAGRVHLAEVSQRQSQ